MVCNFESSSIWAIAYLFLVPSLPEKQLYINKASMDDVGFFSFDRPIFSQKFFTKNSAFNSPIILKKLFQSSLPEALTKTWVDFGWLNPVNLQVASVISWFLKPGKGADWKRGEMTLLFPSHWKETLKTFSNPEPEVCSKMHLPSCKVQQSQSTESRKEFLLLSSPFYHFTLSSPFLCPQGWRQNRRAKDMEHALTWPEVVSQATSAHWGMQTAIQSGWCEFPCPCSDWRWPLKPTTREHITWEPIQNLTGKICAGKIFILCGTMKKCPRSSQGTVPCTASQRTPPLPCLGDRNGIALPEQCSVSAKILTCQCSQRMSLFTKLRGWPISAWWQPRVADRRCSEERITESESNRCQWP